jgi:tetratricopeptide (TPR) repeat protein
VAAALAAAWLAMATGAAQAQPQTVPPPGATHMYVVPELSAPPRPGALSQHPFEPLSTEQAQRLAEIQTMRESGRLDPAREEVDRLLHEVPHHPMVLAELARIHVAKSQWPALERLARAERAATKDSVLLGRELVLALDQQNRQRDEAQIVIELWAAAPAEADWCEETIIRLDALGPKVAREPLRRAVEKLPQRADLVLAAARLEWQHGDSAAALKLLKPGDTATTGTPLRWTFAEGLLHTAAPRDSAGATDVLMDLAADRSRTPEYRLPAARRAWQICVRRGATSEGSLRVANALSDLPPADWSGDLLVDVVRGMREGGHAAEVRTLLGQIGDRRDAFPGLALESALNDLREGPPERALPALEKAVHNSQEGVFQYAEALFYSGMPDSAAALYKLLSSDPTSAFAGPSLERLFLIEDAEPATALVPLGRMAYETWRGEPRKAQVLAESLYHALPRGPLWAYAALELAQRREQAGDAVAALEPLLAVADSLPNDRLAPVARQRAGDVYRLRLKDDAKALAQYEECLARYPKAWNAPEVRRIVQGLRREKRF